MGGLLFLRSSKSQGVRRDCTQASDTVCQTSTPAQVVVPQGKFAVQANLSITSDKRYPTRRSVPRVRMLICSPKGPL